MGRAGHSGFDHQSLHQIKGLIKINLISSKIQPSLAILVIFFGTVTPTSHQSFGKGTLVLSFRILHYWQTNAGN